MPAGKVALRKTQNMALKLEPDDAVSEPAAAPAPAARSFEAAPAQPLPEAMSFIPASRDDRRDDDRRQGERRQGERRGMDQLRAEALRTLISNVEDKNFGGLRSNRISLKGPRIPFSRLLLVGVALIAGGVAAWLATHGEPAPAPAATVPVETVQAAPTTQILVAKGQIGIGQRLSGSLLEWQDWPNSTLRPDYITIAAAPDAMTSMASSVARGEFFPGEPIRAEKLAEAGHGFLSAILGAGMRGVSVQVTADAASGGFIVPNDHVDVVLTRQTDATQMSETILTDVRILAINTRLGSNGASGEGGGDASADPSTEAFANNAIATLELNPTEAETIINATSMGHLSLMLRPTADPEDSTAASEHAANAAIRLSSPFWTR